MLFQYTTKRLSLRILEEADAPLILKFYEDNRELFEAYSPVVPEQYYSLPYQTEVLRAEMKLALKSSSIRYYLFLKDQPDKIIGTVCFSQITRAPYHSTKLGYRIDGVHQKQGYAYEAISYLVPIVFNEQNIHRIEVDILSDNKASIHLAECLGFTFEGITRDCCEIGGIYRDHLRYSLLSTDPPVSAYHPKS